MKRAIGFWENIYLAFKRNKIGVLAFRLLVAFILLGLLAPLLASSKPIVMFYDGDVYFPLFRYFFFTGFFTGSFTGLTVQSSTQSQSNVKLWARIA